MVISLTKGSNANLSREAPGMKKMLVGLGWDARTTTGEEFDLDASAFLLVPSGKVRSEADFIFYNQERSVDGSVLYGGDNRTGAGDGDDETLILELDRISQDVEKIAICVTIHEANVRKQNFGMVSDAFVRCVDLGNQNEVVRFDLSEDYSTETALIFGEIYRHNGEWKFKAVGQGYTGGLTALARHFGVNL